MKHLRILFIALLLSGCATITTVTLPDGDIYKVKGKSDSLVEWTDG